MNPLLASAIYILIGMLLGFSLDNNQSIISVWEVILSIVLVIGLKLMISMVTTDYSYPNIDTKSAVRSLDWDQSAY